MGEKRIGLEEDYARLNGMDEKQLENAKLSKTQEIEIILKTIRAISAKVQDLDEKEGQENKKEALETKLAEFKQIKNVELRNLKKELEEINGYQKNKNAIKRVIAIKNNFEKKKNNLIEQKDNIEQEIKNKDNEIENKSSKEIDKRISELEKIETKDFNNDLAVEYNELFNEKAEIEATKQELKAQIAELENSRKEIEKKIETASVEINKCDFVWKNLFLGKSWKDIHAKSLDGRFSKDKEKVRKEAIAPQPEEKEEAKDIQPEEKEETRALQPEQKEETGVPQLEEKEVIKDTQPIEETINKSQNKETIKLSAKDLYQTQIQEEPINEPEEKETEEKKDKKEITNLPAKPRKIQGFVNFLRNPIKWLKRKIDKKINSQYKINNDEKEEVEKTENKTEDSFIAKLQSMTKDLDKSDKDKQFDKEDAQLALNNAINRINRKKAKKEAKKAEYQRKHGEDEGR